MQYSVLLHRCHTGLYEAVAPAIPGSIGRGKTRNEALERLRDDLKHWLETTEFTTIDVPVTKSEDEKSDTWLKTAGMFEDDPMLEPMLREIYSLRDLPESSGN